MVKIRHMANTFRKIYKKTGNSGSSSDYQLVGNVGVNGVELDIMKGATSSTDGEIGLVPKPTSSDIKMVLKSDGTWGPIFPVGAIYLSATNTNPSEYFGGTWERIADGRFLVGVDLDDDEFGGYSWIGGERTHTLTSNEIPSHAHQWKIRERKIATSSGSDILLGIGSDKSYWTTSAGGGEAHNNLPPFFAVYIWRRTA